MRTKAFIPPPRANVSRVTPPIVDEAPLTPQASAETALPGEAAQRGSQLTDASAPVSPAAHLPVAQILDLNSSVWFQSGAGEDPLNTRLLSALYIAIQCSRLGRTWAVYDINGIPVVYLNDSKVLYGPRELLETYQTLEKLLRAETLDAAHQSLQAFRNSIPSNARKSDVLKILDSNIEHIKSIQ